MPALIEPPTASATAIDSDALGAFAHDVRTPLNAASMVIDVARRLRSGDGDIVLDDELARMLLTAIDDIERLVADIHEVSRIERGKQRLMPGPSSLADAVTAGIIQAGSDISVEVFGPIDGTGPWDGDRLARIVADFVRCVNRSGDGSGQVRISGHGPGRISIECGTPGGREKGVAADVGWGFFRSKAVLQAMGGAVDCDRAEQYLSLRVFLQPD